MAKRFWIAAGAALLSLPTFTAIRAAAPQPHSKGESPKVAVVLSGGGARGAAHIGVLKGLEEMGVPIDFVSGTSFGALVGGLYAVGYSPADLTVLLTRIDWNTVLSDEARRDVLDLENKRYADRGLFRLRLNQGEIELPQGLQSGQRVQQLLDRLTAEPVLRAGGDYDRLRIPFRAIATDLLTGRRHVFAGGSMSTALRASIAIPGLLSPVAFEDTLLIDGGVTDNLPVQAAQDWGADVILAVDVTTPLRTAKSEIRSFVDVIDQTISLHIEENMRVSRGEADLLITPDLRDFDSTQFDRASDLILRGEESVRTRAEELRRVLRQAGVPLNAAAGVDRIDASTFDQDDFTYSSDPLPVAGVEVQGNGTVPSEVVIEAARRAISDSADVGELDEAISRIFATDLFRSVSYELRPGPPQTIVIHVEEAPSSQIGFGLRYDRDYKFTGSVDWKTRRLLGGDSVASARLLLGNVKALEFETSRRAPLRVVFSAAGYVRSFDRLIFAGRDQVADFQDRRLGADASAGFLIGSTGRLSAGFRAERVDIQRGLGSASQPSAETLAGLEGAFRWDSFDDAGFPTAGWKAEATAEWKDAALGSDHSYRRFELSTQRRFGFGAADSLGLGASWKIACGDVPFYEILYAGGQNNFDFSSDRFIGARRDQFASRQRAILRASYRRRLAVWPLGTLRAIYLDVEYNGGFFSSSTRAGRFGSPIHGGGIGLSADVRFLGPIRVMIGKAQQSDWNSYFSLGYRF